MRKAGIYHGHFFILGGTIPILEKNPVEQVRLKELETIIKKSTPQEIILALSTTSEGEYTTDYLKQYLIKLVPEKTKISILGRGLSSGAELEYLNRDTLKHALDGRRS